MSLKISKAGMQDTVQDLGRYGYQHLGINPGGVMDNFSAQAANLLAGNDVNEALIELHFPASVFMFQQPALVALSGADFSASIHGEQISLLQPLLVNTNSILQFHRVVKGARAYLAVHGGIQVPEWLGSRSTHLKAGFGGYKGRALQSNDEILTREDPVFSSLLGGKEFLRLPWKAEEYQTDYTEEVLVLPGNEWDRLTASSKERFTMTSFSITSQSDRMGYRLDNIPLHSISREELVSSAVNFGTIQLLPDGRIIILMADHQTTGGYPRVAHVISAHRKKLAQLKAGDKIQFRFTDEATAEDLLIKQNQHLLQLQNACKFRLSSLLSR